VTITVTSKQQARRGVEDFFGLPLPPGFGGQRRGQQPEEEQVQGAGSGFIIDKAGYILTNNHVVADATAIEVRLASMEDADYGLAAKVVGRDELTDSALIQLTEMPKTPLVPAKFGDSSQLSAGDWVMAIGNPFGLANTVTVGVVSAVGRPAAVATRTQQFIQTDAAINRGNSGGPLLNIRGEVIGMNTMILTDGISQGNVGVGLSVPINTIRDLLPQLREGKVTRGRIAVRLAPQPINEESAKELGLPRTGGAEIYSVEPGGPADKAGMKAGDVIIEYNGQSVNTQNALVSAVSSTRPGTTVPLKVVRDKKTLALSVTVQELDLEAEQRQVARAADPGGRSAAPRDSGVGMSLQDLAGLSRAERDQLELPAGRGGAVVVGVTPFSPAANAGLQEGDVILSFRGQPVRTAAELVSALEALPAGQTARMIVWRGGQEVLAQIRKR
jgi:serine protease Do